MEKRDEKIDLICRVAEDKLAQDIKVIPIDASLGFVDHFIIMTGRNHNHTQALADYIDEELSKQGMPAESVEGFREGHWILMDCGDVLVHIFTKDQREYYGLEDLWKEREK